MELTLDDITAVVGVGDIETSANKYQEVSVNYPESRIPSPGYLELPVMLRPQE